MAQQHAVPSRTRTLALLAVAVYGPQLLPLLGLGPLQGHRHCVEIYLTYFAILPAAFLAFWLGRGPFAWAVSFVGVWLALYFVLRSVRSQRGLTIGALALIALLSGLQALGFSVLLRS